MTDVFVADHSFDPSRAGAALLIAVCTLAEAGIVTTVDSEHAHIIVQLATSILYVIENKTVKCGGGGGSRTFHPHLDSVTY